MNITQSHPHQPVQTRAPYRPLPLHKAFFYFLIAGLAIRFSIYTVLPWLVAQGLSDYEAFIVTFTVPTAVLFALAFAFAKWEGVPESLPTMARRFRLHRPTWRDLLWSLAGLGFLFIATFALTPTRTFILELLPFLQPPAGFPVLINPTLQNQNLPAALNAWLGPDAAGNWKLVVLILILFFFNNFGEELFWRGIIFPRQELVHGRHTWLIHGLLWNLFHLPLYPWYAIYGLPLTFTISFIAQKTGNTWMTILVHSLSNLTLTLMVIGVVTGTIQA